MARTGVTFEIPRPKRGGGEEAPKTKSEMAAGREQKQLILEGLDRNKAKIEEEWRDALKRDAAVFDVEYEGDPTGGGTITEERVADIIRGWVFYTYKGKMGLELYNPENRRIFFRIREPE